jgi:class 3 adenylate cyclase
VTRDLIHDPIQGKLGFSGSSVSLAARMEACTPEGSVFATESFAALLEATGAPGFRSAYSGLRTLPKGMGQQRMYYVETLSSEGTIA